MRGILKRCLVAGLFAGSVGAGVAANAAQARAEEEGPMYTCWCLEPGNTPICCDVCTEGCMGAGYLCCGGDSVE